MSALMRRSQPRTSHQTEHTVAPFRQTGVPESFPQENRQETYEMLQALKGAVSIVDA